MLLFIFVAAWMGGVWGRMDAYACMTESLCNIPETMATLFISHTPRQGREVGGVSGWRDTCTPMADSC